MQNVKISARSLRSLAKTKNIVKKCDDSNYPNIMFLKSVITNISAGRCAIWGDTFGTPPPPPHTKKLATPLMSP